MSDVATALTWLRSPEAIRERCHFLLALAGQDRLAHFTLHLDRLDSAADYVASVIRESYPGLDIPYHARWRHFSAGGIDRWHALRSDLKHLNADEIARIRFDLCVPSVLLDAGAGPDWSFEEPGTHLSIGRSEGLAVASFHAFAAGAFSSDPEHPLRTDAEALRNITHQDIEACFQTSAGNPLVGIEGRAALMRALGAALNARSDLFGTDGRVGRLYDVLKLKALNGALPARDILAAVIDGFGPIWPSRMTLGGENLGDVWHHSAIVTDDATSGLVPFHKLSQWLSYSLVEIFEDAGLRVSGLDDLTGLPEYRNGGLFLDLGVLELRDAALAEVPLPVDHEAIVEWRALTLALLDLIAEPVRERLGKSAEDMPLARVLEGGTWAAGRKIAREKREGGGPPLQVLSDGTVF